MTEELFREDAYLKSCTARVSAVDETGIRLDRTVFYPTGGGQPGDIGTLRRADGTAVASAVHTTKEGKKRIHKHSDKSAHPSLDAAREQVDKLAATARTKHGWTPRKSGGGFKARPADFDLDHLPAAQAARPAKR
jgi:Ser-tRNA(Ala) deacylase AlaX